jgi:hypothetical protein
MRRLPPIIGLAMACSGCAYGPGYGYGYGYGASYPAASYGYGTDYGYAAAPAYGYAAPAYGYVAPYYGYAPVAAVNFGYFGGGNYYREHPWNGNNHWSGGQPHNWSGGEGHHWSGGDGHQGFRGNDFHGNAQARAAPTPPPQVSTPAPHFAGTPRIPPGAGINAGKNYGGPDGGPSR